MEIFLVLCLLMSQAPWGMHLQLVRQDRQPFTARAMAKAGVAHSRETLNWQHAEREPGVWTWDKYDRSFSLLRTNGIEPLVQLMGSAKWATSAPPEVSREGPLSTWYPPQDLDDWAHFVHKAVSHYKGTVHCWEVWNEPDLDYWHGTVEEYAELLTVTYDAIKAVDPLAVVVLGGISHEGIGPDGFLEQLLALHPPFDVANYHDYTGNWAMNARAVQAMLVRYDYNVPVWVTEVGVMGVSREEQARQLPLVYTKLLGAGIERIYWFIGVDTRSGSTGYEQMGLLDGEGRRQPLLRAYQAMTFRRETSGDLRVANPVRPDVSVGW